MKITSKYHLTATEKKHIKAIIANGWLKGSTKIKSYEMEATETGFVGKVYAVERNDGAKKLNAHSLLRLLWTRKTHNDVER